MRERGEIGEEEREWEREGEEREWERERGVLTEYNFFQFPHHSLNTSDISCTIGSSFDLITSEGLLTQTCCQRGHYITYPEFTTIHSLRCTYEAGKIPYQWNRTLDNSLTIKPSTTSTNTGTTSINTVTTSTNTVETAAGCGECR